MAISLEEISEYYKKLDPKEFKERIKRIARKLGELPFVVSVFGLGYPFYGEYDVLRRVKETLKKDPGSRAVLPDIDLLLVYVGGERAIDLEDDNLLSKIMEDFEDVVGKDATKWKEVYRELIEKYGVADRDKDLIQEFRRGRIHIDINPVPLELWENLPYLFHPDDMKNLRKLERDLLFTSEHLHTSIKDANLEKVPWMFLKNRLLHTIYENQGLREDELIEKILRSHAYWHLMEKFPEIKEKQREKWKRAIGELKKEGLVRLEAGKVFVTKKGEKEHKNLLQVRNKVRKRFRIL